MKMSKKVLSILLSVLMIALTASCLSVCFTVSAVEVGDTIQFGYYPQTRVSANTALKNTANAATWKSYGYYVGTGSIGDTYVGQDVVINMYESNFMQFADFFYGGEKYRAVKFTQYRPYETFRTPTAHFSYQDDAGYSLNTTYYYKYEPLTWRVLDPAEGLVLCENVIDSQPFQNVAWVERTDPDHGDTYTWKDARQWDKVYANNYASSSVTSFLNCHFYDTAFSGSQREKIKTTTIYNWAHYAPWSKYDAPDTTQPIFLLHYHESQRSTYGLDSDSARKAKGTDYANCQGVYRETVSGFSPWWTRSPSATGEFTCIVDTTGNNGNFEHVYSTTVGIRPACCLSNLTSDTSQSQGLYSAGTSELSLVASPAAGGTVSGGGVYTTGALVTIDATPKANYVFECWKQGDTTVSTSAIYRYRLTGDTCLTAYFKQKPRNVVVSADPSAGGTVTGGGLYEVGQTVTVKATPKPGYKFVQWERYARGLDGQWFWSKESTEATYSFTVESYFTNDTQYRAVFEENTTPEPTKYTVTANAQTGGSATGGGTFDDGATATLTATPNSGYYFIGWYEGSNKVTEIESYTFTVTKDVSLTAKFLEADKMIQLKKPTDQLNDGDWYFDADATYAALAQTMEVSVDDLITFTDGLFYKVIAKYDPVSGVLILQSATSDDPNDSSVYCPGDIGYEDYTAGVKQYHAPTQPENVCHWCGKVHEGFFQKIIGFFHNIMAKIFGAKY